MRWKILSAIAVIAILLCGAYLYFTNSKDEGFQVDSLLIKTAIKSNGGYEGQIKITNIGDKSNFELKIRGPENILSASEKSFKLEKGQTKNIVLRFSNNEGISGGVYTGIIEISSSGMKKEIPVIVEIESDDVLFDSNTALFPSGKISSGDKINAEIKVFDLSDIGAANVDTEYFIKDFSGKTLISEKESISIKDSVLITKSFNLPKDAEIQDYVFAVVLKYKNSLAVSTSFFSVEKKSQTFYFSGEEPYLFIIILFLILALSIFIFYIFYSKDKALQELKKEYKKELEEQEKYLEEKEKQNSLLLKTEEERELNKRLFIGLRKKRRNYIKEVHAKRVKEIKRLKKSNKSEEMRKQIEQWKKKGYNTSVFEGEMRAPSINDIKKQIEQWKKKGYNTSILDNRKV
jgi:large-conductance mechanosensitive channel